MSGSFNCPECDHAVTRCMDSRPSGEPVPCIRRRRKCLKCGHRFTTKELLDDVDLSGFVRIDQLSYDGRCAVHSLIAALPLSRTPQL